LQASRAKKICETSSQWEKSWVWWSLPVIPVKLKKEDYGPGWPGQKVRSYLQNNQSKKGLGAWLKQ
jgi:hypothetical protein